MRSSQPNVDLTTADDNKAHWNAPDHRRDGFHNLYRIARYVHSFRAPRVAKLRKQIDWNIADRDDVRRFTSMPGMSAFVVVNDERILHESYAADFGAEGVHSIQSITKMTLNLMLGPLVANGSIDLDAPVSNYIAEAGSGYAQAILRDVADMNIENHYSEDYTDPHTGSYAMETAIGWRLPDDGCAEPTIRSFVAAVSGDDLTNRSGHANYKSTNSDLLGWIIERVSGRSLTSHLIDITEAAGIENNFHICCDRDGVPLVDGGGCLNARDLARVGLLFARYGEGVDGRRVGDPDFLESCRREPGPPMPGERDWIRYSRQVMTNETWFGHGGYGGQFLLADPDTGTVAVYFSVLENKDGYDPEFYAPLVAMMGDVAANHR